MTASVALLAADLTEAACVPGVCGADAMRIGAEMAEAIDAAVLDAAVEVVERAVADGSVALTAVGQEDVIERLHSTAMSAWEAYEHSGMALRDAQHQLDGWRARALRAEADAQRWREHEAACAAAGREVAA